VTPSRQLIPSWLVTFTLLGCIGLIGAFTTEEARYRLLSISPVFRSKQTAGLQDEVVRMLQRKPGMKLSDIKRSAGNLGFGTLLPLERQGVIFSTRDGLSRRFYAQRTNENSNEFLSGRILSWILEHPMTWEAQVAKELGLSQQLVHYHLKRLHAQGLLTATLEANGNRKLYRFSGKK
jgi:predicted transcriptional regulator